MFQENVFLSGIFFRMVMLLEIVSLSPIPNSSGKGTEKFCAKPTKRRIENSDSCSFSSILTHEIVDHHSD